jgi:hypothetical protein
VDPYVLLRIALAGNIIPLKSNASVGGSRSVSPRSACVAQSYFRKSSTIAPRRSVIFRILPWCPRWLVGTAPAKALHDRVAQGSRRTTRRLAWVLLGFLIVAATAA